MRIAMFVAKFPAVSETFILNQIAGLIERGHSVDIYSVDPPDDGPIHPIIRRHRLLDRTIWLKQGPASRATRSRMLGHIRGWLRPEGMKRLVRIVRANPKGMGFRRISLLKMASRELNEGPYDVVHCQFGNLGRRLCPVVRLGLIHGRLVTSFRGHDLTQQHRQRVDYYGELARAGDLFLPVSKDLEDRLIRLGFPREKIEVLHSAIDCSFFRYAPRNLIEGEPVRIATVARMVEMKGIAYGIDAVAAVIRSGRSVRYDIVGDGPLRPALARQIERLGLSDAVTLHGWLAQAELLSLLQDSHILLAPSITADNGETEGIPNAVKEAMAMGIPVVATRHGGVPELVEHTVSGLLAPERDSAALAEHLLSLCRSPELRLDMALAARARVEGEFDKEALNRRLAQLLAPGCATSSRPAADASAVPGGT